MAPRYDGYGFAPYVPVAQRRLNALKAMNARRKKGLDVQPIEKMSGRIIAKTFWGKQWCEHMESFHDFENRLPRGRTYARNGSVCHLGIEKGRVEAFVMGSELYEISVDIKTLSKQRWSKMKQACAGRIGSLLELLQGRLSEEIMAIVTDSDDGLFPKPKEISFECDCPDWATMCKHAAAVFYGIGARLDAQPELLFVLRGVDHEELLAVDAGAVGAITSGRGADASESIGDGDLSDIFGIDIAGADSSPAEPVKKRPTKRKATRKKKAKKAAAVKKKSVKKSVKKAAAKKKGVKKSVKKAAAKKKGVKKATTTKKKTAKRKAVKKKPASTKRASKNSPKKTVKKKAVKKASSTATKKKVAKKTKKKPAKRKAVKKKATRSARRS